MGLQCEWFRSFLFLFRKEQTNALHTLTERGGFVSFFDLLPGVRNIQQLPHLAKNIEADASILIILRDCFNKKCST